MPADLGGCGHYRLIMASEHLRSLGHDVIVQFPGGTDSGFQIAFDENQNIINFKLPEDDVDVLVMQRASHQWHRQAIPLIRKSGISVVIDMDDDLSSIHPKNGAFWRYREHSRTPFSAKNAELICKEASLVTVSTKNLLARYAKHGRGHVIDNYVPERYLYVNPAEERPEPTFGWAGTLQSHPADVAVVGRAVRDLVDAGHQFRVVGPPDPDLRTQFRLAQDPQTTGIVSMFDWPTAIADTLDIGLAPLEPGTFNTSKCIDASHRVLTRRGLLLARDLTVGDEVLRHGEWRQIRAVEVSQPRPGLVVTTEAGYQLRLTPEHRMLIGGKWVQAADMRIGMAIEMEPETITGAGSLQTVPWPADSRMTRTEFDPSSFWTAPDGPRVEITPTWGLVLGAIAGDGSLGGSAGIATRLEFSCDGQDQDWIDTLKARLADIGLNATQTPTKTWDGQVLRRQTVRVASAHLLRVLERLGLAAFKDPTNPKASRVVRQPCVPDVIWKSSRPVIAAFLSGYFETDGTVNASSVSVTSKTRDLIMGVHRLLLLFGIKSRVTAVYNRAQTGPKREYWQLYLARDASDRFAQQIGFQSRRKQEKLKLLTGKRHSNAFKPIVWADEIKSIEPCEVHPVDIQVDGEEFVCEGFVSHNSRLKLLEYASVGVPYVASPRTEYQRFHKDSGGAGFLADTPKQWVQHTKQLLTDDSLRRELSEMGRAYAATQTVEEQSWRWLEAWERAINLDRNGGA